MTYSNKLKNIPKKILKNDNFAIDNIKILSEFIKKDIEKSYNLNSVKGTEAYFSSRYGWTLRKSLD